MITKLSLGYAGSAKQKHEGRSTDRSEWRFDDHRRCGYGSWHSSSYANKTD